MWTTGTGTTNWGVPLQIAMVCPVCSHPDTMPMSRSKVAPLIREAIRLAHPDRHPAERQAKATAVTAQLNRLLAELDPPK